MLFILDSSGNTITKRREVTVKNKRPIVLKGVAIGNQVLSSFPELELGTSGCKVANSSKNYTYIGGCYLKGIQSTNYIWYSGFLWRIMGINADGTIKLITEENISAIPFGEILSDFDASNTDNWLNNYFYRYLKGTEVIKSNPYCQSAIITTTPTRIDCTGGTLLNKKIGLISIDEYNLASGTTSYLKNSQYFWTMSKYSSTIPWAVNETGSVEKNMSASKMLGIRAVINIDPKAIITDGNGKISNIWNSVASPYILNENKNLTVSDPLNISASSGEYVKLANKIYRVVSVDEAGNTKLVLDGYYQENGGNVSIEYGTNNILNLSSGIGQKLNSDVFNYLIPSTDTNNLNKIVNNYNWYQTGFSYGYSYISSLDEINIKNKITSPIGLLRIGEMLSGTSYTILTNNGTEACNSSNGAYYWTLNTYGSNSIWVISRAGDTYYNDVSWGESIRPTIVVKNTTNIIGGNGTPSSPYEI